MPKADLAGIKFKTSKKKNYGNDSENSFEKELSGSDNDVSEEERVDSPEITMVMKDSSFINNTIVATASLLNEPFSSMSTVR